jgi:hypothetical protein
MEDTRGIASFGGILVLFFLFPPNRVQFYKIKANVVFGQFYGKQKKKEMEKFKF